MTGVLVDTSVWVGHFRTHNPALERLLQRDAVLTHLMVVGEIGLRAGGYDVARFYPDDARSGVVDTGPAAGRLGCPIRRGAPRGAMKKARRA